MPVRGGPLPQAWCNTCWFEVDHIVNYHIDATETFWYLIKWKHWSLHETTWIQEWHVYAADKEIAQMFKRVHGTSDQLKANK